MREHQFRQLSLLFQHFWKSVPWCRERLKKAGYKPGTGVTHELMNRIPLMTRDDIQNTGNALFSPSIPKEHGNTEFIQTSGSTGKPVRIKRSNITEFFLQSLMLRDHYWHERNLGGKLAVIRFVEDQNKARAPNGMHAKGWSPATDTIYRTGKSSLLNIHTPVREQAEWLLREDPDYLLTYPSNLQALAQHIRNSGIHCPKLVELRTIGETLDDETREICREVFNLPVVDIYSASEVGNIALQCPEHTHYHIQSESVYVEILNDDDQPCAPGEVGRVVVTALHNLAMPVIRYVQEDYAEVGEPCPCGRGLPVLRRIKGRARNMLTLPSGDQVWPRLRIQKFASTANAPIVQVQFVQHTLEDIEVRIVTRESLDHQQEQALTELLHQALEYPFNLTFRYHDEIQRSKNGKYEEFISKLDQPV